ncbi:MAG: hypothetical protein ACYCX9_05085 [Candidatus Dormibacteria bacterium]
MADQDPDPAQSPPAAEVGATEPTDAQGSGSEPLPEFLNPESIHYQPWAEKQISNASKEKRPLADFMAEMEERLSSYGEVPQARWDPARQEQLLARFAVATPGRSRRRHRRRGSSSAVPAAPVGPSEARPGGAPKGQRRRHKTASAATAPTPAPTPQGQDPGAHRRRRRRRRPRGGEGTAPAAPSA